MPQGYASRFDTVDYNATQERLIQSVMQHPGVGTRSRPGVRSGGLAVSIGGIPEAAIVAPGGGVIDDDAAGGSYQFVVPAAVTLPLGSRPGTGTSRIGFVVARIKNSDHRPADGAKEPVLELIQGTEGAAPSAPIVPAGSLVIRQLTIPASGTVSLSRTAQRTVALGGVLPVADTTERDAISPVYDGIVVYVESSDLLQVRRDGAWKTLRVDEAALPFAQAAGVGAVSGSGVIGGGTATVTVPLPAGRFTQPPIVTFSVAGFVTNTAFVVARQADQVTATSFRAVLTNTGTITASWSNLPIQWHAVQMTATSAAG